jgi:hypothetical protein
MEELQICECKLENIRRRYQGLRYWGCCDGYCTRAVTGAPLDLLICFGWILAFELLDCTVFAAWTRLLTL